MSPTPLTQTPPEPAEPASLDERLRAWFETMLAQPVPESLLRRVDELDAADTESV